jgi:PAS domain S-box-containing protein
MSANSAIAGVYPENEVVLLVARLHETHQQLQQLTGGELDAVLHSGGQSYLLYEAQERLRRSEATQQAAAATLSSILNALPAHIALLDSQGVIISVNEGWLDFAAGNSLDRAPSQIGRNYLEICESTRGACAREAHEAARGIRGVLCDALPAFSMEYPCHSPTQQRWFQLIAAPIGGSGVGGAVVMHMDITVRRLAQDAVQESESRFRGIFSAAATGIAISTLDGHYLQANAAYCQMLGYSEEELRTRDFASLTHPSDLDRNLKVRDELLAGKREDFTMEKRYIRKDGSILWTRISVSAARAPGGEPVNLIVVAEDITAQKIAVEEVRRSASLLSMASRVGRTGAWILDFPAAFLTWSAGMRAIHDVPPDYTPTFLEGIEFYLPEYREMVRTTVEQCAEKGVSFDFEAQIP